MLLEFSPATLPPQSAPNLPEATPQARPIGCVRQPALPAASGGELRPACKAQVCPGNCRHKRA